MWELGITLGCSTGWYCPDNPALRSQMAVFVVRSLFSGDNFQCNVPYDGFSPGSCTAVVSKCDCAATIPYFTDVPPNHGQYKWIQKIRQLGISLGTSATTYTPDGGTSKIAAGILTNRARQIQPCYPEGHVTPGCFGVVNDQFVDVSTKGYFPLDLPQTSDPNGDFYRRVGQKMRDTGTIALGPQERYYGVWDSLSRGEASYYITRGLRKDMLVNRKISQVNPAVTVWEPSFARGSNTWLATWFQQDINNPLSFTSYAATWNSTSQVWNLPFQMNLPSGQTGGDDYIIWDAYRGRFLSVFLMAGGAVRFGYSDTTTYQSWTFYDVLTPETGGWDFPSVAVNGSGHVIVGATKFLGNQVLGFHVRVAYDGYNFASGPTKVDAGPFADGRISRVVATRNMFHAFIPSLAGLQPYAVRYLYSGDGINWTMSHLDPFVTFPLSYLYTPTSDHACEPGSTTDGCRPVFLAPFIDATGDPNSDRWSFVIPMPNGNFNNMLICVSDAYCGLVTPDSTRHQFLGSSAISPDGTYWVTYHSYSRTVEKPASNITTHVVRIPPGAGALASYTTTHGTAPATWRNFRSARCDNQFCYAAGDYNRMAIDTSGRLAVPLIQQSPMRYNDLYSVFMQDPSSWGVFYPPYTATVPTTQTIEPPKSPLERLASLLIPPVSVPSTQFYDPLPASARVQPTPDPKISQTFVRFPAGSDLRSQGIAAPMPSKDLYFDYLREKIPDYFRSVQDGK